MFVKICKHCDKAFISKSSKSVYCTRSCMAKAQSQRAREDSQVCWTCGKACGKCLWSAFAIPVFGWTAKPIIIKDSEGDFKSYRIKKCPLYIKG